MSFESLLQSLDADCTNGQDSGLRRRRLSLKDRVLCILATGFGALASGLLLATLLQSIQNGECECGGVSQAAQTHTATFGRSVQYMSLDHKWDWVWKQDMEGTNSIINLNHGKEDDSPVWGSIAMFHALHCLTGIRHALQRAREGEDIGIDENDDPHWPHCFDYMRKTILCMADDTIERPSSLKSVLLGNGSIVAKPAGAIDGSSDVRVCRDSEKLYRMRYEQGYEIERKRLDWLRNNTADHEST